MKNIIFMLLIALLFNGCISSSLSLSKSGDVNLHYNEDTSTIGNQTKKDKLLFFTDLSIQQYTIVGNEGNILFGEQAQTSLVYEFTETELNTIMYIFDESRKSEMVYKRGNLQFVQVQLKNKSYVNVLIQANDLQEYSYIYGFSNEEFVKIANTVKVKDTEVIMPRFKAVTFKEGAKPQTNWNNYIIIYTPLIRAMNLRRGR